MLNIQHGKGKLANMCNMISAIVIHHMDSIVVVVVTSKFSRFCLV